MKKTIRIDTLKACDELEFRAIEALKALLGQVSAFRLKEMKREPLSQEWTGQGAAWPQAHIQARIDVHGHSHMLACGVQASADPRNLREVLTELQRSAAHISRDATPVLIAPYLSPAAQELCKQNHAAFLDLEGNARLVLGEVFIGKRSLHHPPGVLRAH